MKSLRNRLFHLIVLSLLCIASAVIVFPATAAATITTVGLWHPGTTLTTLTTGPGADPFPRYVDAEVWVTSNTPFWSVQLSCTVTPSVLKDYPLDPGDSTEDGGDNVPMVQWGPAWGVYATDFTQAPGTFNTSNGTLTTAAARLGNAPPLGNLGTAQSLLLATFHYQVRTTAGTSPFKCVTTFLDSNGNSVGTATYTPPTPLTVIAGYTIAGSASYQARTAKSGIGINCAGPNGQFPAGVTDSNGKFSITTRALGNFTCKLFGNTTSIGSAPHTDLYPWQQFYFRLTTNSYTLLPVMMKGGNVERSTTPDVIFPEDLLKITSNYNVNTTEGDVNGDGKTNQTDLSVTAGNYGFREGQPNSHVLYGVPRSWVGNPGPDNRIWLGDPNSGRVTPIGTSTSRDLWPMLSPDGSKIAFTRQVGNKYSLGIMNADGTGVGRLTPDSATYNAYAPSWSPDGSRIAFDCATWEAVFNKTDICVIDVTGRNFQKWGSGTIYPPAWISNTQFLFGGSCGGTTTICMIDIGTSTQPVEFNSLIDTSGGRTNDQPVVVPNSTGSTTTLFYRSINGPNQMLYWKNLPLDEAPVPAMSGSFPISISIDYYTVSTDGRLNIMYYQYLPTTQCRGTSIFNAFYNIGTAKWDSTGTPHTIDNAYCSPTWSGDPAAPTDLWAQRNTFNWVP